MIGEVGIVYARLGLREVIVVAEVVQAGGFLRQRLLGSSVYCVESSRRIRSFLSLARSFGFSTRLASCAVMYELDKVVGCSPK